MTASTEQSGGFAAAAEKEVDVAPSDGVDTTRTPSLEGGREDKDERGGPSDESAEYDTEAGIKRIQSTRSQNGFGCDENPEEAEGAAAKVDPFIVDWDGGDADPLSPRSRKYWNKWMIVLINSVAAGCV